MPCTRPVAVTGSAVRRWPRTDRPRAELRAVYPKGLDREDQSAVFSRNRSFVQLKAARDILVARHLAEERTEPSEGAGGRNRQVLYAVAKSTKKTTKVPLAPQN